MVQTNETRKRTLGLALGGGGARGLAHIGVLKALEQAGIRVDYLAGTSMGGLLAALYAAGWSPTDLEREALRVSRGSQIIRLVDPAPPRRGLLEGNRVRAYLERLCGPACRFEDLRIPLALAAVDLNRGEEVVLRQGPLVEAVLATTAVPGLFPPVEWQGCRLADGGLLDNIPTGAARELGADFILAVDVSPDLLGKDGFQGEAARQIWPAWLPPFTRDFYLAEVIMISTLTRIRLAQAPPDMLLRPPVPLTVSTFWGLGHAAEAIAAGERAMWEAIPDLLSRLKEPEIVQREASA